ncbi:hypothetical protein [Paenarthrobacter ureafaciens]|uniref:hypothetical protein n=1 Tax=Paenarthrobacter ureafaciens TaxID=37931 RepID=UPI002DB9D70C|nr:hypothetical protein [Paenarthrobacter ureafaciens]MEC3853461.1 hypothetical protein [Paenarthrobacter ureafaciens]
MTDHKSDQTKAPLEGTAMSALSELKTIFEDLIPAETTQAVQQLRWILESLPADSQSAADRRLRSDLELFLAGYEIGAQQASGECPR